MVAKPVVLEFGMGVDVHGLDATTAACRAVSDAIRHSSLPLLQEVRERGGRMLVDVTVGVPDPASVDTARVKKELPQATEVPIRTAMPAAPDPVRRMYQRYVPQFDVALKTVGELLVFNTREISAGGMSLFSQDPLPLESAVVLRIVHPADGRTYALSGIIRRCKPSPGGHLLAIQFVDLDEARRAELLSFIQRWRLSYSIM